MKEAGTTGALNGIKVVEFADGIAVGYLGALLAACGADVIKIEQPISGDAVRLRQTLRAV